MLNNQQFDATNAHQKIGPCYQMYTIIILEDSNATWLL